jgi:hypothetical protein
MAVVRKAPPGSNCSTVTASGHAGRLSEIHGCACRGPHPILGNGSRFLRETPEFLPTPPRPLGFPRVGGRLFRGPFAAAAAEVGFLAGGVSLTRVSTRSAVSRSVNRVATVARSASRRASRSLTFVFSAAIWSNIVGVVVGMVTFSGFRSIRMINLAGV